MKIYYTPSGLPSAVPWTAELGEKIIHLFQSYFKEGVTLDHRIEVVTDTLALHGQVGDLFQLALEDVKLTPSARSFIIQHATAVASRYGEVRKPADWTHWQLMLKPNEGLDIPITPPKWSDDEKRILAAASATHEFSRYERIVEAVDISGYYSMLRSWLTPHT